jgi:transcriptional regulator with XRE-family HTH domain
MPYRPPKRPPVTQEAKDVARAEFARLIREYMNAGFCADGANVKEIGPWTVKALARRTGVEENTVEKWISNTVSYLPRPDTVTKLADLFFGADPKYSERRREFLSTYRLATGRQSLPPQTNDGATNLGHAADRLVEFSAEPKRDTKDPNVCHIDVGLLFAVSTGNQTELDGDTRSISIGVKQGSLRIASKSHEIIPASVAGRGRTKSSNLSVQPWGIGLLGPKDERGRMSGAPLPKPRAVSLRRTNKTNDAEAHLAVVVRREAIDIVDDASGRPVVDPNKFAVLSSCFAEKFRADAAEIVLADRSLDLSFGSA